jgi:hypothetical protein
MVDKSLTIESLGIQKFSWQGESLEELDKNDSVTVFDSLVFEIFIVLSDEVMPNKMNHKRDVWKTDVS